ncbi:hypothetical protein HN698_00135 [Candidatus Woesearchaeota archaeon]|nr:hypothetical protein [Candidatus Woesearchaeota archaeon]MBT4698170.1 hypothetical protein [Candidatus Woesearchaeota archaeon]MBT4716349.1 hypothetical protein [Candidatus Woesearchaeota archaeon]MBT7930309.1 hypothetical protein [Candidatus Woesearchaeota archaeon]
MGGTDLPLQARILLLNIDPAVGRVMQRATKKVLDRTYEFPTQTGRSVESLDGQLEGVDLVIMSIGNVPALQDKSYAQLDDLVEQGTKTIVMSGGGNSATAYGRGANGYIALPANSELMAQTLQDVLTVGKDAGRIRYDQAH